MRPTAWAAGHLPCQPARILRAPNPSPPIDKNYVIFDTDRPQVIRPPSAPEPGRDKTYRPTSVHAAISVPQNELPARMTSVQTYRDEVVKRIYSHYQNSCSNPTPLISTTCRSLTAFLLEENAVREVRQQIYYCSRGRIPGYSTRRAVPAGAAPGFGD